MYSTRVMVCLVPRTVYRELFKIETFVDNSKIPKPRELIKKKVGL